MAKLLAAASGYCDLGMAEEANDALEQLPHEIRTCREVLALRALVYCGAGAWDLLREVAGFLVRNWPDESQHWIWLGYAVRRCTSVPDAEKVLREALPLHGGDPIIHFNLACYAAQSGEIGKAREHLSTAIRLDPSVRAMALDDKDLEPLWESPGCSGPGEFS